jgi:hypothetical protein
MSADQTRIELFIDVFEHKNQRARVLRGLKLSELIESILQEFHEIEYLSDTPADYELVRASDGTPLDEHQPIGRQPQLNNGNNHLILTEKTWPLSAGMQRPAHLLYLREQPGGNVYKLHGVPAVIGRVSQQQQGTEPVVVDLAAHGAGLRVSRRHAQIIEEAGRYAVESLSSNPTVVQDSSGNRTPLPLNTRHPLQSGDLIHLERSDIMLKFIVRAAAQPQE